MFAVVTQGSMQALHKCGHLRGMSDHRTLALVLVEDHLECCRHYDIFLDCTEECRDPNLIQTEREGNMFNLEHGRYTLNKRAKQ